MDEDNKCTAVATVEPQPVAKTVGDNLEVTATSPDEMCLAQEAMIRWAEAKVAELRAEHSEAVETHEYAKAHKWRTEPLMRAASKSLKRLTFYEKILAALQHGFTIIPNFPVTAFAIRTDKKKPLKMVTTSWGKTHEQSPVGLPVGAGEYENPFPNIWERTVKPATQTTSEVKEYWVDAWKELEFPITMAKPQIMAAATRAMAMKIFDDLSILPGYGPRDATRPPKGDPIIVARIHDFSRCTNPWRRKKEYRHVTFMVAWHIDTRTL